LDRTSDGFRQNANSSDKNNSLTAQFRNESFRAGVDLQNFSNYSQWPGSLTQIQYEQNPLLSTIQGEWGSNQSNVYGGFVEAELADTTIRMDMKRRDVNYSSYLLYSSGFNSSYSITAKKVFKSTDFRNTFLMGVDSIEWASNWSFANETYDTHSVFFKNDLDFIRTGTRLTVGIRNENVDRDTTSTYGIPSSSNLMRAWELGLSQPLGDQLSIYGKLAQAFRLPNIDEMTALSTDINGNYFALMPQTSHTAEVGSKYRFDQEKQMQVRAYRSQITNEIVYDNLAYYNTDGYAGNGANINLPQTQRQGIDVTFSDQIDSQLMVAGTYSYKQATVESGQYAGNTIPLVPSQMLTLRGAYKLSGNQLLSLSSTTVSSQFASADFNDQNKIPSYTVADAKYSYKYDNMEFSLSIKNLLNRQYYSYGVWGWSGYGVYPDPGRNFMGVVKLNF
jgi:iron complex outermembrane receptor protein